VRVRVWVGVGVRVGVLVGVTVGVSVGVTVGVSVGVVVLSGVGLVTVSGQVALNGSVIPLPIITTLFVITPEVVIGIVTVR